MLYIPLFDSSKRKTLQSYVLFAGEKIYPDFNAKCSRKFMRISDQSAIKMLSNSLKIVGILCFSNIFIGISIILTFILYDEIQMPIPVIFPFTDLESAAGLIINFASQFLMVFMIVIGNIGVEIATCILKNSVWMITVSLCHSIDVITEKIMDPLSNSKTSIDYRFQNILIQVQDLDRYV